MDKLKRMNTATVAVMDVRQQEALSPGAGTLELLDSRPDRLRYAAQVDKAGLAVFSEIHYPEGWVAEINGEELPIYRVNYLLRGLNLPEGAYEISMRFEPKSYFGTKTLLVIFQYVSVLLLLGALGVAFGQKQRRMPPKLLHIFPQASSFIQEDQAQLENYFEVLQDVRPWTDKRKAIGNFLGQGLFLLRRLAEVDYVLVQFAGYWSFLPTLLGKWYGKPVYIVLHGTDVAALPELGYGSLRIPLLRRAIHWSLKWATALFPVSSALVWTELHFDTRIQNRKQGLYAHFPDLLSPVAIIRQGVNTRFWAAPHQLPRQEKQFAAVMGPGQEYLKGLDFIGELAKQMPEYTFHIAGIAAEKHSSLPPNVYLLGRLDAEALRELYRCSGFYLQLSLFEGFGCALVEAMAAGCLPIVAQTMHLPHIIGESGYLLPYRTLYAWEALWKQIESEREAWGTLRQRAQNRAKTYFDSTLRGEYLQEAIRI
ncbi:group 1 glycosyl transferase [Nitritalea halalkaliphila LW7]|uniref:Group 1 glycosyl transferase n=2 Tax=Nitritalea TaxID=1187887 RepID=I5CAL2_9BACT|nr:group 1 glycosyl transferase [Nitritalea halalkaliphila LW7]